MHPSERNYDANSGICITNSTIEALKIYDDTGLFLTIYSKRTECRTLRYGPGAETQLGIRVVGDRWSWVYAYPFRPDIAKCWTWEITGVWYADQIAIAPGEGC